MPLTIRRGTLADVSLVVDYNCRMALETEGKPLDAEIVTAGVTAALADPEGKGPYFLAESDSQVLGQLQITFEWSDWRNGWFWWFQGVYVRPEARGRGVFRALFEHIREEARRTPQVIGLRLYVERHNRAAQEVYSRLGMAHVGYLVFEKCPV